MRMKKTMKEIKEQLLNHKRELESIHGPLGPPLKRIVAVGNMGPPVYQWWDGGSKSLKRFVEKHHADKSISKIVVQYIYIPYSSAHSEVVVWER
jgi:hypothetical protein